MIAQPFCLFCHDDRRIVREDAAGLTKLGVDNEVEARGSREDEAARSLLAVAMAHIQARIGQAEVERAISMARQSVDAD